MARVIAIGDPVNDSERRVIKHLRDNLPDSYTLVHNFEVKRDSESFEVDLAIVAPHAVYIVDVKGTRGLIDVYGSKWYPEGRQPFSSPFLKLKGHSRTLKGIVTDSQPGRRDLNEIYFDPVVILSSDDAHLVDPGGVDTANVTTLKKAEKFFRNTNRIPPRFSKNIAACHKMVFKAIDGVAKPRSGPLMFGSWEVAEKLGSTNTVTEYRAFNSFAGKSAGTVRLRAYQADPYQPEEERKKQLNFISNAYQALSKMPAHPNIIGAKDFFSTESEDQYILVTEDVPGQALKLHINKPNLALTVEQKIGIAKDVLGGLKHAHSHGVVHRNLSPSNVIVSSGGTARLSGFEYARGTTDRTKTIAHEIVDDLEESYIAPELLGEPSAASGSSDVFTAGLVLFELFTGEKPYKNATEIFDQAGVFSKKPSEIRGELSSQMDSWLQSLCTFDPAKRPTAEQALSELVDLSVPEQEEDDAKESEPKVAPPIDEAEYKNLPSGYQLSHKYVVESRLGQPGSFGVVYKVIDTLGDVTRAVKLVLRDRYSTIERLKKEYKTLLHVPLHKNVVQVYDADLLPDGPPYIVFEYVDGIDVGEMVTDKMFSADDALFLAKEVLGGLKHLHKNGVYHCDIKPRNLIWTDRGVKIIDFNVSVLSDSGNGKGGGSRRYLPPDLDLSSTPTPADLIDRDLYALGVTLYEAATGQYPWDTAVPQPGKDAPDPRNFSGLSDLTPVFVDVLLGLIKPNRADRFTSVDEVLEILNSIEQAKVPSPPEAGTGTWTVPSLSGGEPIKPNTNPYINHLLTLYSQSKFTNAGTRGLDEIGKETYVPTLLDEKLVPAVLNGEYQLVVVSGNAGDGKTALIQQLEAEAVKKGAEIDDTPINGSRFKLNGRDFITNHDGSQDEGDRDSDTVLSDFFGSFKGDASSDWFTDETKVIAINEGRLIDFLTTNAQEYPLLDSIVRAGLGGATNEHKVAVLNLNLRSVVADPDGLENSIFEKLLRRMTHEKFWDPCLGCDLKNKCYAFHNAQTIRDDVAGPKVTERLKDLYTLTHLRGRLHITIRDLRSSLAFMLAGERDCDAIHELYESGDRETILQSFYFNSWKGGDSPTADRLLTLLKDVDPGATTNPQIDRELDFCEPGLDQGLFRIDGRADYDLKILQSFYQNLPRDLSGKTSRDRAIAHQRYVSQLRRKYFFERRDDNWKEMLPYRSGDKLLRALKGDSDASELLDNLLRALNRGEGIFDPDSIGENIALQVRNVTKGTIKSYRLFSRDSFSLAPTNEFSLKDYIEHMPEGLTVRYRNSDGDTADLVINLDVFEMLERLNQGYAPTLEEQQGYLLSLGVFKNILGSAPYQKVLLTSSGHDLYQIERHEGGMLELTRAKGGAL